MSVAVWDAASGAPVRFLISWWPARIWWFLLAGIGWGAVVLAALFLPLFLAWIGLGAVALLLAVGALVLLPLLSGPLARMERSRVGLVEPRPLIVAAAPARSYGGALARVGIAVRDRTTWRELGYTMAAGLLTVVTGTVPILLLLLSLMLLVAPLVVWAAAPDTVMIIPGRAVAGPVQALPASMVGLVGLVGSAYAGAAVSGVQVQLARGLLGVRGGDLDRRILDLTRSQMRLVDAFAAERRRIERDLHDGAQQQLVALSMTLGLLELELAGTENGQTARLLHRAKAEAAEARLQLRDLVQGIHEQVLVDDGLPAALDVLAQRSAVPVALDVDIPHRLGAPVETTAYFAVAEALTNAAKHAEATAITVNARLWSIEGVQTLVVEVTDNGSGGADLALGSGLQGIADRIAVLSGRMSVASPRGGPTTIRTEVPCQA